MLFAISSTCFEVLQVKYYQSICLPFVLFPVHLFCLNKNGTMTPVPRRDLNLWRRVSGATRWCHVALGLCPSCAVVANRGFDTISNFGHVDPHRVLKPSCAGSYGPVFSTNLCGHPDGLDGGCGRILTAPEAPWKNVSARVRRESRKSQCMHSAPSTDNRRPHP